MFYALGKGTSGCWCQGFQTTEHVAELDRKVGLLSQGPLYYLEASILIKAVPSQTQKPNCIILLPCDPERIDTKADGGKRRWAEAAQTYTWADTTRSFKDRLPSAWRLKAHFQEVGKEWHFDCLKIPIRC